VASASDVAAAVLERTGAIDAFKLQKLVYYCQGWHLVWAGEPLFDDRIEAWANGPVVPALYRLHRGQFLVDKIEGRGDRLAPHEAETVQAVVDAYRHLSGRQLAHLTHQEAPWQRARVGVAPGEHGNHDIELEWMAEFYGGLDSDPDAAPVDEIPAAPAG
jgi:uncharacterized phage-associated protein